MKKIYNNIVTCMAIFVLPCLMAACGYSEDPLEASGDALTYKLPQGNNDYDQTIVGYYQKYGTYILYKFEDKEAYWTPSGWKNGIEGDMNTGKAGYLVKASDPSYINKQLNLLNDVWFSNYSEKFLKAFLPVKILLCSKVDSVGYNWTTRPVSISGRKVGAWYNYYNICVNYGDSTIDQLTAIDKRKFKDKLNRVFIQSIVDRALVTPTTEFAEATNYTGVSKIYDNAKLWALGTFPQGYSATPARDWGVFMLMMVTHSESFLNATLTTVNTKDNTEAGWKGILTKAKDTNGILKKRYDMVRNYFKENYDIDLQEIGNHLND